MSKKYLVSYVKKNEQLFTTESIKTKVVTVDKDNFENEYDFKYYIETDIDSYNDIAIISLSEIPTFRPSNIREIQAYSTNSDNELDYKRKYWFHHWIDKETALVENQGGQLLEAKYKEFSFK